MATLSPPAGRSTLTLAHDSSRWDDDLCGNSRDIIELGRARRELAATLSAVVGGRRRIEMHHNEQGRWSVIVGDALETTVILEWSCYTPDESNAGWRRNVTRGEALSTLVHEAMHVLYTDNVAIPSWVDPSHRDQFHMILNFAEDVRIEDLGEAVVPAFANLRRKENERLVGPNVTNWPHADLTRQVCSVLFCEVSAQSGARKFAPLLRNNPNIDHLIRNARPSFVFATQANDTAGVINRLRPFYDLLAPYLTGTTPPPPPPTDTEEGEDGEDTGTGEGGGEGDDDTGTPVNGDTTDPGEDDSDTSGDDDDTDGDDDITSESRDNDGGEDEAPPDSKTTTPTSHETIRPNAPRGQWEQIVEREQGPVPTDRNGYDSYFDGDPISWNDSYDSGGFVSASRIRSSTVTGRVVKNLRRVLQDNSNGGWSTRKRSGVFDPGQSTRIALGDMRTFRKRREAKGSLDYSLVVCLDSSSSVSGLVGQAIADAGLSMVDAAARIPGLDVAICAYGGTVHYAIPFDKCVHDVHRDGSRNIGRLSSLLSGCQDGVGGGTHEALALTWAFAASEKRAAQSQMVVVITDGAPSYRYEIPSLIEDARSRGIRTGGIGVMHAAPSYHEYAVRVDELVELPATLADLIRTMMKGR